MNAPTFTPGPWKVSPRDVSFYTQGDSDILIDGAEARIAEWPTSSFLQFEIEGPSPVSGRGWLNGPDALLVAAAPDLYAALERLSNEVFGVLGAYEMALRTEIGNTNFGVLELRMNEARAALAKARGEK